MTLRAAGWQRDAPQFFISKTIENAGVFDAEAMQGTSKTLVF